MFYDIKSGINDNVRDNVVIADGTKDISVNAYSNMGITSLSLPEGLESIGAYAFANNKIEKVIIPSTIKSMGMDCFALNRLKEVILKEGITIIPRESFFRNNIESIILPNSLKKIETGAFYHNNLSMVFIPSGVEKIEKNAFDNIDVEYRGILITKEEIEKYGCESIISLARKKKNANIMNNKDNVIAEEKSEDDVKEKQKNIDFKPFFKEDSSITNNYEIINAIINLSNSMDKEYYKNIEELKLEINFRCAMLKCRESLLEDKINTKSAIDLTLKSLLDSYKSEVPKDMELFKRVLLLTKKEQSDYELSVEKLNIEIASLKETVENKKRLLEKLTNKKNVINETANHIQSNYNIK